MEYKEAMKFSDRFAFCFSQNRVFQSLKIRFWEDFL